MNLKFLKTCNHKPTQIFSHDEINYYASDEDNTLFFRGDLVVNLTQMPGIRATSTAYSIDGLKNHLINLPPEIVIGWVDMAGPPVKASFWTALHLYCKSKNYKNVLFHCQHGHGRTGTALSAMLISLKKYSASTALSKIRRSYCRMCVETEIQVTYLLLLDNELNGRLPPEEEDDFEKVVQDLLPPRFIKR